MKKKNITRYDYDSYSESMEPIYDGDYVSFTDYLALRQNKDASIKHLKGVINEIAKLVQRNQKKESLIDAVKRHVNKTTT